MDKVKKLLLFSIPMSICNFRCHYCYLAQREECYQGIQPKMRYSPEQVRKAMSKERIGGTAYMNFCADGETLLVKDLDKYVKELVEEGHYAEIVSNMTITPMLDKILAWDRALLSHVEFKCSFHYLELRKRNLLEKFAENVNRAWKAGASITVEVTPSDELIPYIEELKAFSMKHFGALPHLTIARNDRKKSIDYLTDLSMDEYDKVWGAFNSDFWKFKKSIFGVKQTEYCYAGLWSLYIDLTTGEATSCYCGPRLKNVFANPNEPIDYQPVGKCPLAHCYNGHALMTLGAIPGETKTCYGDIRDRKRLDGTNWLQPELRAFFNTKLEDSNIPFSEVKKMSYRIKKQYRQGRTIPLKVTTKVKRLIKKCVKR